jgi:lipid-A-disaccharide synthase
MHKKIVIIAGEASGDLHAATLVKQLKTRTDHEFSFSGLGGQHMQEVGVNIIYDLARYGVTGLSGIVRHIKILRQAWKAITQHLITQRPDVLILVDYPGFNLRLAKFAKRKLGLKIIYYISPQIWAWRAKRINIIRQYVDHMAVIFPFEKEIYTKAQIPVSFVGHPLTKTINHQQKITKSNFKIATDSLVIAMLPGSRTHEINYHMPVLRDCATLLAQSIPNLHIIIPIANTIQPQQIEKYLDKINIPYTLVAGQTLEVVKCSDAVIVASGTASLECALLEKPMCIIYKGGLLSYLIASQVIQVKYFGLCNLLGNAMIVPELLQYDCTAKELARVILTILLDPKHANKITTNLRNLRESLSSDQADCTLSDLI